MESTGPPVFHTPKREPRRSAPRLLHDLGSRSESLSWPPQIPRACTQLCPATKRKAHPARFLLSDAGAILLRPRDVLRTQFFPPGCEAHPSPRSARELSRLQTLRGESPAAPADGPTQ